MLHFDERWLFIGSLQLELFCSRPGKWDKLPYIQAFIFLRNKDSNKEGTRWMIQREGKANIPLLDSKTQEENM